jgi:hypothetical protein
MTIRIDHDDEDGTIEVHPDQHLVRLVWKRPVVREAYRNLLMRLLDVVRGQGIKLWLSDGRKAGPILQEDQVWTMCEYTPQVIAAGLERIAIVNSKDGLNLIAVDKLVNATPPDAPYDVAFFEDPAIAQLWLMDPQPRSASVDAPAGKASE